MDRAPRARRPYKPGSINASSRRDAVSVARNIVRRSIQALRRPPAPKSYVKRGRFTRPGDRGFLAGNDYKYVDLASATYECSTTGSITFGCHDCTGYYG